MAIPKRGRSHKGAEHRRAAAQVAAWNAAHQPGVAVIVTRDDGASFHTRTRSVAWVICDRALVLVEGISGGYRLDRVSPRGADPCTRSTSAPAISR